jgi:hypothetical protein
VRITENNLRKIVKELISESSLLSKAQGDIYTLTQNIQDSISPDDEQASKIDKEISYIQEMFPINDFDDDTANALLHSLSNLIDYVSSSDSLDDESKEDFASELKEIHDMLLYDERVNQ